MSRLTILIVCGLVISGGVLFLVLQFPNALTQRDGQIQLTHALLIISVVGGAAILHGRLRVKQAVRDALVWVAIGTVILAGYSYRHEFTDVGQRMIGELMPHRGMVNADGAVTLRVGDHGHFVAEAVVNGTTIRFLVDTGASDVTLSPADAERVGFDLAALNYNRIYNTANGTVAGAPVRLDEVRIASVNLRDVRASVNSAAMKRSLLGMSFLSRLSGFEVRRGEMILWP